jgi:two-component system nitrate/nitrite sensor histidine kinase NarX
MSSGFELQAMASKDATTAQHPLGAAAGLAEESELRTPISQFLDAVVRLAKCRAATLRLLDAPSGELRLVAAHGMPDSLNRRTIRVDIDCEVCRSALRNDASGEAPALCACARELSTGSPETGDERVYALPLHFRGSPCGVLGLFFSSAAEIPESVSALLPAIGDMLALALENVRLAKESLQLGVLHERHLLAAEVHDSLAQNLTFTRMRTAMLRDAINRHDEPRALKYLGEMELSLGGAHGRIRELISNFRTRVDPQGLIHALSDTVDRMNQLGGVKIGFDNRVAALDLSEEQQRQIFYLVSEALANIVKHAQAKTGRLTLEQRDDGYRITVEDDGIGFRDDDARTPGHDSFGLSIMRERASRLGGRMDVSGGPGSGTRILISIPSHANGIEVRA